MNQLATIEPRNTSVNAQTAVEMRAQVVRIQEVMTAVFRQDTHYGRLPGAGDKPVLFKAGAEVLCATFRIAPEFRIEDLSTSDEIRYRVACVGRHQQSGIALGEGVGEASTDEEKYKWRAAVCDEEFEATEIDRRRVKYGKKSGGGHYTVNQVRTNKADIANTVLKMASKRALVAMTLVVTAASDCFTQDLEDMPQEVREAVTADDNTAATTEKPTTQQPQQRAGSGGGLATEKQIKLVTLKLTNAQLTVGDFCKHFEINAMAELPFAKVNDALAWIADHAD